MKSKNPLACLLFLLVSISWTSAQSVQGVWVTTDEKSGNKVAHVKVYKQNGKLNGKVIKLLPDAKTTHCKKCTGDRKGKSLVNMDIFWDLEPNKDSWNNGQILNPQSGKIYDCSVWLENENTLNVRGSVGVSLFGKTQTWSRLNNEQSGG